MRPTAADPGLVVLDLLARADELAATAAAAIDAGDDAALSAVLEDRAVTIDAAIAAWKTAAADRPSPELQARVARAARSAVTTGQLASDMAARARAQVVSELTSLDARQQASHEYQSDVPRGSFDVVL